jgi:hypothetical protein
MSRRPLATNERRIQVVGAALRAAAAEFRVSVKAIRGPRKSGRVLTARWAAIKQMRAEGLSLLMIAKAVNRDHSTVIHALERLSPIASFEDEGSRGLSARELRLFDEAWHRAFPGGADYSHGAAVVHIFTGCAQDAGEYVAQSVASGKNIVRLAGAQPMERA